MQESTPSPKAMTPMYAEEIHMLEGLEDDRIGKYLDENPRIIPLFEIDVVETVETYTTPKTATEQDEEPNEEVMMELHRAQHTFDQEMEISRRLTLTLLEEINVGNFEAPRALLVAKDLHPAEKAAMIALLHEYKDVFAWSHEDMKGLDPKFYQHQMNLTKDAKPDEQRRYRQGRSQRQVYNEEKE